MGLSEKKRKLLSDFVNNCCEECHKNEKEILKLQPHRIRRGCKGGKYEHRNIKMLCSGCHKLYHFKEFQKHLNINKYQFNYKKVVHQKRCMQELLKKEILKY